MGDCKKNAWWLNLLVIPLIRAGIEKWRENKPKREARKAKRKAKRAARKAARKARRK